MYAYDTAAPLPRGDRATISARCRGCKLHHPGALLEVAGEAPIRSCCAGACEVPAKLPSNKLAIPPQYSVVDLDVCGKLLRRAVERQAPHDTQAPRSQSHPPRAEPSKRGSMNGRTMASASSRLCAAGSMDRAASLA